jgi:hypothetical protein
MKKKWSTRCWDNAIAKPKKRKKKKKEKRKGMKCQKVA